MCNQKAHTAGAAYEGSFLCAAKRRILLVSSSPARILTSQKAHARLILCAAKAAHTACFGKQSSAKPLHAYPWGAKHLRAKPLLYAQPKGAYCSRSLYFVEVSSIEHQAKGKKHILLKYFILTAKRLIRTLRVSRIVTEERKPFAY